jgi:hypothetical protein
MRKENFLTIVRMVFAFQKLAKLMPVVIYTATFTLAIFEPDKIEILGLLMRLALSDNSPASMAVLQSALALSSFHRNGLKADVYRLKARALRILITSCIPCIEDLMVVQHIAASMILCHLEVCLRLGVCPCEQTLTGAQDAWNAELSICVVL